jgi:hypothetical protein
VSSTPLSLGEGLGERSLIILFIFIRLNIDINLVLRESGTHVLFDVVNQLRCLRFVFALDVNLCSDKDIIRTEVNGLDIDEAVDFCSVECLFDAS